MKDLINLSLYTTMFGVASAFLWQVVVMTRYLKISEGFLNDDITNSVNIRP